MLHLHLDRCLCSTWAAPVLIASCWAALTAAAVAHCSVALPHCLKLCTRSSLKLLSALPCRICLCDTLSISWHMESPKATPLEVCHGARMGHTLATGQLGRCWGWQMYWVREWERAGTTLLNLADGSLHCRETLGFSQMGLLSVSFSPVYLSIYY